MKKSLLNVLISSRNMLDRWIEALQKEEDKKTASIETEDVLKELVPSLKDTDTESVYQSIMPGDIIDAVMPMSLEKLKGVPFDHRHRPYIVVKKENGIVFAYTGTSNADKVNKKLSFYLTKDAYHVWKDGYIEMSRNIIIEKDHLICVLDKLKARDMLAMNQILDQEKMNPNNHPRFDVKAEIRQGDVITRKNRYYYVYSMKANEALLFALEKKKKSRIKAGFEGNVYYILPAEGIEARDLQSYLPAGRLENSVDSMIRRHRQSSEKKDVRKEETHRIRETEEHQFLFPIGTIIRKENEKMIYLFSQGNKHYGIPLGEVKQEVLQIRRIKNMQAFVKEGRLKGPALTGVVHRLSRYDQKLTWLLSHLSRENTPRRGTKGRKESPQ